MKNRLGYFILLCGLLNSLSSDAQITSPGLDSLGQKITTSLSGYYKKYPQEKIYLHTDQNVYLSGQTCWYKAYTQAYGKPSQLSKILYVYLSDANGKLIKENKLPIKNGTAYGNINLPDSLHTGWYQLKSFTAWMLNFGEDGFYHQKIYIQNIHDGDNPAVAAPAIKTYHLNFFPEGGDLVEGNICNVAFKAVDEKGLPAKVYGFVLDNNKKPIAKLTTIHDGMGTFELEVYANANYTAQVHFPDNSIQNIDLPKAKKTGITLRVNASATDELDVKIPYAGKQEHRDILIAAVQNNGLSAAYPLRLSRGTNVFGFKKNCFSTGILRLTVFDESGFPRAERIVYINNNDQLKPSLAKDTLSFNRRSKNSFTIHLKDNKDQPVKANLSVAVTDASIGNEWDENICSYLLMSSELRGYIHQPAYYFKNNSDTLQQQLDLVMLTNGWRHFKWDTVLNNKPLTLNHFVERSQLIAGKVENYHDKDNLKIKLIVLNNDSSKFMGYVEPDSAGIFSINDYNRQGTAKMYFEAVNNNNRKQPLKVTFFKPDVDTARLWADTLSSLTETKPVISKKFLDSVIIEQKARFITEGVMLRTVNIKAHKLTPTELVVNSHVKHLPLDNGYNLDMINTPSVPTTDIFDYIQGRFPGFKVLKTPEGGYIFQGRGPNYIASDSSKSSTGMTEGGPTMPFFYIDEAQVTLEDVVDVPLNNVALICFSPPPVWFAPTNGGGVGVLMIYTKTYEDDKNDLKKRNRPLNQYTFNSYSITREFSSPDYSITKPNQSPDYRTTLYWNHDLNTDDQGNIKIHFYNSDKAKKYRVIIQTMDADGRVGYLNEEF